MTDPAAAAPASASATAPSPDAARIALVTGASRGIGRHLAIGLAAAGLDVGVLARDAAKLADVAAQITALGRRCAVVSADVTSASAVDDAVNRIESELGPIDLLVNNAGRIDAEVPLWEADRDEWWAVVETNVRGPFLFARAVVPGMIARGGGRIININSGAGTRDLPDISAYNASKTALFRIGGSLHVAGFELGLRAFELAPGVVRTDMSTSMRAHDDRTEWTEPQVVVDLVVAMASGEVDHVSGCYVRAGLDTPESLRGRPAAAERAPQARRLSVSDWS